MIKEEKIAIIEEILFEMRLLFLYIIYGIIIIHNIIAQINPKTVIARDCVVVE